MQNIDRDIICRAADGDMKAFEEIYKTFSSYVYTLALRVCNNAEDAQEITQDVFVNVYRKLKKFEFRSTFKTWIYRITVNTAINSYRRRMKRNKKEVVYNDAIDPGEGTRPSSEIGEKEDKEKRIKELLAVLTPEQRACVVLRHIEGMKYKEIAKNLKLKINTVRTRLKRARERIIAYDKKGERYE